MIGVRVVIETGDFPVALVPVKRVGFGQRPIGVQAQRLQPSFPGGGFERSQHAARDAQSPGRRGRPDPLDFSRRFVDALEAAASDRFVIETGDHHGLFTFTRNPSARAKLIRDLVKAGFDVASFSETTRALEDTYFANVRNGGTTP